jgi:hypothetical protein
MERSASRLKVKGYDLQIHLVRTSLSISSESIFGHLDSLKECANC